jgi:Tfp pilus assembly protein PilF
MSPPPLSRGRRRLIALVVFIAAGVGVWRLVVHASAWSHFSRAREALDRDDPAAARPHLARCLGTWPKSGETHFLAAQAARRDGDLTAAIHHLDDAARLNWVPDAITLERALIRGASGQFASVEGLLIRCVLDNHPESPHILPVVAHGYMGEARWIEADRAAQMWTDRKPESAKAWAVRGEILERLLRKQECVEALRTAVKLNPADRRVRFTLARVLLDAREPADEAAGHLEALDEPGAGDPAVRVQLARCREAQGKPDDAAAILDRVIADHPPDAKPLHLRGRLEMNRGRAAAALPFLRKASELDRSDVDMLYSLFLCLQQTGPPEAAREAEARWKQTDADLKRVADLSRLISASPRNPDLRREMGELFLRNGRDADGLRWLESALREDPSHAATHAALAAYYTRTGRPDLAARHRP